jgi:putative ABC transport system permease protein
MLRHKNQCLVGVIGLATGFTAYILISLFVQYEYSWDKHNINYDRIYRVQRHFLDVTKSIEGNNVSPHTRAITSKVINEKFPEIESVLLLRENRKAGLGFISSNAENQFFEENGIIADKTIFDIFTYKFLEGSQRIALNEPNNIVLSKKVAEKLFGKQSAVGKSVTLEKKYNFKVTGVYDDLPLNSIIRPTFIISLSTMEQTENVRENIWSGNFMTYVLLKKNTNYQELNTKLKGLHKNIQGIENEEIKLCPLSILHLNFNDNDNYIKVLKLYKLIGLMILLLTAFNYINLFTALSTNRSKEMALRKVSGSIKYGLASLFLSEAALMSIVAIVLAFTFAELLLPVFNGIMRSDLSINYLQNWPFLIKAVIIAVIVGALSAAYPAFVMASQKITLLMKGTAMKSGSEKIGLRKTLISFQYIISVFLIILSFSITIQLKYMMNKDLGMNKENLLFTRFETKSAIGDFDQLRNRLLTHPEIINASMSWRIPMYEHGGWEANWEGGQPEEKIHFRYNKVNYDFVENMGLQIVSGRDFSRQFRGDVGKACIINETGAKALGWDNPIGKWIGRNNLHVVGVAKDFHINNTFSKIEPYLMELQGNEMRDDRIYAFRIAPGKIHDAEKVLKEELEHTFPNDAFELHLFSYDIKQNDIYKIFGSINDSLYFFTIISIILTAMGLFGLISFTIQRQTKEIGIRKINGALPWHVFIRICNEYFMLVLVGSAIAWPLAYQAVAGLPGTYKAPLNIWTYIGALGIALIVTFITMLYFTLKAAYQNPVEALRYE